MSNPKRIAVIGAGPIGLEAALYGSRLGHIVEVFERGAVGDNILRWGFVTLFSPWAMNHSTLGASAVGASGTALPDDSAFLNGSEYVRRYLRPLALSPELAGRIHERTRVLYVGRETLGKPDFIGGGRDAFPFRLLVADTDGERVCRADVVIDCSGTYGHPNWMGSGGIPAPGERGRSDRIRYELEDVAGSRRERYSGRRVLLVGAGLSAATVLDALRGVDFLSATWVVRKDREQPVQVIDDDPLPERARLAKLANRMAAGADPRIEYRAGTVVERVEDGPKAVRVELRRGQRAETVEVDRILALVGFSPDNTLYSELQVHECYATGGPMKLAAALLASNAADCLSQTAKGPQTLVHPEPNFFILGAKSYGRNSSFLIRLGLEQVREVYSLIEDRPDLDLHRC